MRYAISLLILAFGLLASTAFGQPPDSEKWEKIKQHKIAYLTSKVNFTSEEAQQFWPIYNEYTQKLRAIQNERVAKMVKWRRTDALPEKEILELLDYQILSKEKEVALFKEYNAKYLKILSAEKVMLLYQSENNFRRDLLKRYSGEHGSRRGK